MIRTIDKNQFYRHFKNHWYKVIDVAEHTETGEFLVVYYPLYGDRRIFARPLKMFIEEVPEEKENPTGQQYRFMSINELGGDESIIHED